MKPGRQSVILQIIEEKPIETQSQLIDELKAHGIVTTQATLSRDINDLELIKENGRYARSVNSMAKENHDRLRRIFRESVISCTIAQNIIVIKTLPGLANAACSAIDHIKLDGLAGSIAGDDTAFLAMSDNNAAKQLLDYINEYF